MTDTVRPLYWPESVKSDAWYSDTNQKPSSNPVLPDLSTPTASRALVIIDMQESFPAACDPDVKNSCKELVQKFVENNEYIFVLEYFNSGESSYQVTHPLQGGYDKVFWIRKSINDGSPQIMNALSLLKANDVNINELIICGVNTAYCVADTVGGLIRSSAVKITVVASAVNDDRYGARDGDWDPLNRIRGFQKDNTQLNILE